MTIQARFRLRNYKTFKDEGVSLERIAHINIIIGKNNVGKSSFLDVLDFICSNNDIHFLGRVEVKSHLGKGFVLINMPSQTIINASGYQDRVSNEDLIETNVRWLARGDERQLIDTDRTLTGAQKRQLEQAIAELTIGTESYKHVRLLAERDITPEQEFKSILKSENLSLSSKGTGASQIIHAYLHDDSRDHEVVDRDILTALNEIFGGDLQFRGIKTKQNMGSSLWEIFLAEQTQEYFSLSRSGSGLKTILLVLINLLIRPILENKDISNYIFSFEELENNLHPSLQRNLFLYLERFACNNNCHIFITSHSHIAIDVFSESPEAQIVHIVKHGTETIGRVFSNTTHGYRILDDLGVRASDILQSNGIIWIEGPSDRIFINKFIELWSCGKLREGAHYQFAFYGGSVLSNFDVSIPKSNFEDALKIFRINKNAIFVCDGDKRNTGDDHKARVVMLSERLDHEQGLLWITEVREIENYIPKEAFQKVHGGSCTNEIGELEYIQEYLNKHTGSTATEYREKVRKATDYSTHFTLENLQFRPELDGVMKTICAKIRLWNHI